MQDFRINVPESVLADLRERLADTRWPEALPGDPWERGASLQYIKELCAYWQAEYGWSAWLR